MRFPIFPSGSPSWRWLSELVSVDTTLALFICGKPLPGRRVTRRTPCTLSVTLFNSRPVTLLAQPTFHDINSFAPLPCQLEQGETISACAIAVGSGKGVDVFLI